LDGWQRVDDTAEWHPAYRKLDDAAEAVFQRGSDRAEVYVGRYLRQSGAHELVMWGNGLVPAEQRSPDQWRVRHRDSVRLGGEAGQVVGRAVVGRGDDRMTVYYGYVVDGVLTDSVFGVKWLTLRARLLGRPDSGSIVTVALPGEHVGKAGQRLAAGMFKAITQRLAGPSGRHHGSA